MRDELTLNPSTTVGAAGDTSLVSRVAAGDTIAFEELYDVYALPIFNYLLRLIDEPAVAEEILQEVFLVMWRNARHFREEAAVKTWLLRIAHHQAVSWLRRQRPVLWPNDEFEPQVLEELDDHLTQRWQIAQVRRALTQLTPKQRAVVELTFVHGLSYAEAAQVLGCPLGTVKSRLSYALQSLANWLTLHPDGD